MLPSLRLLSCPPVSLSYLPLSGLLPQPYLLIVGRALEDLRGSLFNEFRSSEGAKRQQQRTCGPAAALSFNFFIAISIIFINKMVRLLSFLSVWLVCVLCQNFK